MTKSRKHDQYQRIQEQLSDLLTKTDDPIARMATIVAVLHHKMPDFFWTGFYRLVDNELLVGPYQGTLACQKLQKDVGVCWAAIIRNETVVVPDISAFPGHIACDSRSRSEITVPCLIGSSGARVVLDVDSTQLNTFDQTDARALEAIVQMI
ncbi:MAG: GAF domain-containing protein [Phycisphaerae bacterium]|nr:GAF domain-containing protein [Phycisphaerae bacterium]